MKKFFCYLLFLVILIGSFAYYNSKKIITITVKKTESVQYNKTHKYLVYTEKKGVFENTDTIIFNKYNSSDLQNLLEEGKTYKDFGKR